MSNEQSPEMLNRYQRYSDAWLVAEFWYLTPLTDDPYEAAEQICAMDSTDVAHLYAVAYAMAKRIDEDD